ncbi:hypothetical protein PENDEC_c013G03340 [Penicillium decumbens]|uniref:Uncharacterized protein n=1 Tax=Penicillium decumbens TaxID=69771 RepID=A0A1V6PA90_PENDC|nr:hypothetical protein PENDEC_c013G03340 [Penicillium decumbens]
MPDDAQKNHPTTSVHGGSSAVPTPANAAGWGDRTFRRGGSEKEPINEGEGHVPANKPRDTIGKFLGLRDQKERAETKFSQMAALADDMEPVREDGEPTCASEDHSFMGRKPGGSDTWPGWEQAKNVFGAGNPN